MLTARRHALLLARRSALVCVLLAAPALAPFAAAQGWPGRPIRLVAPLAPGGTADPVPRLVAGALGERQPGLAEGPTLRVQGIGLASASWFGPARLPGALIDRPTFEIRAILAEPRVRARFAGNPGAPSPVGFAASVAAEVARSAPVVRESGAQPD